MSAKDQSPSEEIFATPANEHFLKQHSYPDLNPLEHEIRLVHVFKKPGNDLICCDFLPPQKLTDISKKYCTISYCAGSAEDPKPILLQGIEFNIFANLDCALRETLSYWNTIDAEVACILWVDQIYINQYNDAERSHQVKFLKKIYLNSGGTFICLSTAEADKPGPNALSWFSQRDVHELTLGHSFDVSLEDYVNGWNAFYNLIECPWWSRAWIRQEFSCSQIAIFLYQNETLQFSELEWLQALCHSDLYSTVHARVDRFCGPLPFPVEIEKEMESLRKRQISARESCWAAKGLLFQKSLFANDSLEYKVDIKKLMMRALDSKATDPRDKIFCQLGLTHRGYNIMPNYSKSNTLSRVLTDTAARIIQFEGNLDIL
ncbi:heterokaryon incompatibility 6 OR allele, partial [Fusarium pseudocircinatum]